MKIKMRRPRQALSADEITAILNTATNGILALQGDEDYPYAVPMSFAYDGRDIYLHSAFEGHKSFRHRGLKYRINSLYVYQLIADDVR